MNGHKKRVLLLADSLPNGGAERQLLLLSSHLQQPWEPRVLTLDGGPYVRAVLDAGVALLVAARGWKYDPLPALCVWDAVAAWRPHVVHSWGWMSTLVALPVCRVLGIPVVDGSIRMGMRSSRWRRTSALARAGCTAVVTNSRAGLEAWGLSGARTRVIYNAFDPARCALASGRRAARASSERPAVRVVMTGRMVPGKDFHLLVDAARTLLAEDPDGWRFTLVGQGSGRTRLQERVRALGLDDAVTVADGGLEVMRVVAESDIGVLLTVAGLHAEGCSNSILEYFAAGLPVVCTRDGGNGELVVDGVNGALVAPGDLRGLLAALRRFGSDPALVARSGEANRAAIDGRFTVERMVTQYAELYESLLAGRHRR